MRKYRDILSIVIPLIISFSICVIMVRQVRQVAWNSEDNKVTFFSFVDGIEEYKQLRKEWRPRILSNYLAGYLVKLVYTQYQPVDKDAAMYYIPSLWTSIWLFLTFLIYVIRFREKSLLYIFGTYAGVSFGYMPGLGINKIYPWDLPILFFFSCFIILIDLRKYRWLFLLIPIATLFKETALVLSVAFLFMDHVPGRKRAINFMAVLGISVILKIIVDLLTTNPSPLLSMSSTNTFGSLLIIDNISDFFRLSFQHPILVNAGLVLSLLLLPLINLRIRMLKMICIIFVLGNFLFAVIDEYRIWFELIPLSLYGIDIYFFGASDQPILHDNELNTSTL